MQYPVLDSQTYIIADPDMETKVFSSGDKKIHCTRCLLCSATKIFIGHGEGLSSLMVIVFGNLERNSSATREQLGANGRAERHI